MRLTDIAKALRQTTSERDYPEDAAHENGRYHCLCIICDHVFVGHKRRVVCKLCSNKRRSNEVQS